MNKQKNKFERSIADMQIPANRRGGSVENARWFLRNGAIVNRDHPDILIAICHALRLAE